MTSQIPFSEQVRHCIAELSAKDLGALAALYDLTAARLVRLAVALTHNQHDAEDAVHTVLVRVATQPHVVSHATCPWPYMLRMVRNESLQIARRQRRCQSGGDLSPYRFQSTSLCNDKTRGETVSF